MPGYVEVLHGVLLRWRGVSYSIALCSSVAAFTFWDWPWDKHFNFTYFLPCFFMIVFVCAGAFYLHRNLICKSRVFGNQNLVFLFSSFCADGINICKILCLPINCRNVFDHVGGESNSSGIHILQLNKGQGNEKPLLQRNLDFACPLVLELLLVTRNLENSFWYC